MGLEDITKAFSILTIVVGVNLIQYSFTQRDNLAQTYLLQTEIPVNQENLSRAYKFARNNSSSERNGKAGLVLTALGALGLCYKEE